MSGERCLVFLMALPKYVGKSSKKGPKAYQNNDIFENRIWFTVYVYNFKSSRQCFHEFAKLLGKQKRVFTNMHQFFGCNHLMAVRFFIYSINDCYFYSKTCESRLVKCDLNKFNKASYPRMGYHADKLETFFRNASAKFYLDTKENLGLH